MRHVYRWPAMRLLGPSETAATVLGTTIVSDPDFGVTDFPAGWVYLGYPLDEPTAWAQPRAGVVAPRRIGSGEEDAWQGPIDYFLTGNIRWIDPGDGSKATSFATSWADTMTFLAAAMQGQRILWVPNTRIRPLVGQEAYLMDGQVAPALEADLTVTVPITLRSASPFVLY